MHQMKTFNIGLIALIIFSLNACAGLPQPDTTMRVYENASVTKMNYAVEKSFSQLGYLAERAKLNKFVTTQESEGKSSKITTYKYGLATRPVNDCFEMAGTESTFYENKKLLIVKLNLLEASCFNSIGKINVGIERDKSKYEQFFNTLSQISGNEGKRVGLKPL